jgi:leucyl aminopeptidase
MDIDVKTGNVEDEARDLAIILIPESKKMPNKPSSLKRIDTALHGTIKGLYEDEEFNGKKDQVTLLHAFGHLGTKRIMLLGLGDRKKLKSDSLRKASATAAERAREKKFKSIAYELPEELLKIPVDKQAEDIVLGIKLSRYRFEKHVQKKDRRQDVATINIVCSKRSHKRVAKSVGQAEIISDGVNLARDIGNDSGMDVTPNTIGLLSQRIAKKNGFKCEILDEKAIKKLNMGGLLNVGKGSANPPRLVVMEYGSKKNPTVALVGKGMVFDSGGISLKPSKEMDVMKSDKSGAATVIGIMQAVAQLKLPIHLIGLAPLAENMPSGKSYKPGDIIYTMSGNSVEVLNTDAEGRLILADGLTYAQRYNPKYVIDIATLTGACVVALGSHVAGLLGTDRTLVKKLREAGDSTGERLWELPMLEEYAEQMKSEIADIRNVGGRDGGCITAASFLSKFSEGNRWAHLDIAGTAWSNENKGYIRKGATGFGVRLILEFLRRAK